MLPSRPRDELRKMLSITASRSLFRGAAPKVFSASEQMDLPISMRCGAEEL
jgi:hypothetical protein